MYKNLYNHPEQVAAAERARVIISDLFEAYRNNPALMPASWSNGLTDDETQRMRHIADFLAGMTDRYAADRHMEIFKVSP